MVLRSAETRSAHEGPRIRVVAQRSALPQLAAVAGALAAGVLLGGSVVRAFSPNPALGSSRDAVWAGGELARALEQDGAVRVDDPRPVRIGATFRARGGRWCRTFTTREGGGIGGVACREDGAWRVEMMTRTPPTPHTRMRAAAPETPAAVQAAAGQLMVGSALDAATERRVRQAGWR